MSPKELVVLSRRWLLSGTARASKVIDKNEAMKERYLQVVSDTRHLLTGIEQVAQSPYLLYVAPLPGDTKPWLREQIGTALRDTVHAVTVHVGTEVRLDLTFLQNLTLFLLVGLTYPAATVFLQTAVYGTQYICGEQLGNCLASIGIKEVLISG